jgi:chondroitin AC lyase
LNKFNLTLPGNYQAQAEGVTLLFNANQGYTEISVNLPQGVYAGKSVTLKLK